MIFKFIKASIAVVTLLVFSVATHAAELPIKAQPYIGKAPLRSVVAYYNWTGFYVGINGGYGFGQSNWDSAFGAFDVKPKGAMVGGTLGYNWQAGSFVYGIEGDFDWSSVKGSAACGIGFTCETSNPWLGTIRGRLGYAFDRFLPYLTGGGAYGNIKTSINSLPPLSSDESKFGYTLGAEG
jgi:outer membrane immunogenic protein